MIPLQLTFPDVPEWVVLISQLSQIVVTILGVLIAYTAYKGYRRNDSRPMFFIAVGFALAIGLPFLLVLVVLFLQSSTAATVVSLVSRLLTLVGLACILYALRL